MKISKTTTICFSSVEEKLEVILALNKLREDAGHEFSDDPNDPIWKIHELIHSTDYNVISKQFNS